MRKLHSAHGLYKFLPELKKGELVYYHGKAFQLDADRYRVFSMRYDSAPSLFGTVYSWYPDLPAYVLIGDDLFYCPECLTYLEQQIRH